VIGRNAYRQASQKPRRAGIALIVIGNVVVLTRFGEPRA